MKKRIVITEEDGLIEIKKFISDSKGEFKEVEDFSNIIDTSRIIRMGMYQEKRSIINKKK